MIFEHLEWFKSLVWIKKYLSPKSPLALGSLSVCDDTPAIPTGSGPSSDPRPAVPFLKVTEMETSPLNTGHVDTGKYSLSWSALMVNWFCSLFACLFFFLSEWGLLYFLSSTILSFSWVEREEANTSWLLQALYPTFQDLNSSSGKVYIV